MVSWLLYDSVTRSLSCSISVTIGMAVGMAIGVPLRTSVDKFICSTVGSHFGQGFTRSVREVLTMGFLDFERRQKKRRDMLSYGLPNCLLSG